MLHIHPVSNLVRQIFPHRFILPNRLFAKFDKLVNAIFFYIFFAVEAQTFFNFNFNRQSMSVPASLSKDIVPLHSLKSWDNIFHGSCQNMANVRFAICRWRAVMQNKNLVRIFVLLKSLFDNIVFLPKLCNFFLICHKIKFAFNFAIHFFLL